MHRIKSLVAFLCGLFIIAQGLAFVAYAEPPAMASAGTTAMGMEHCRTHMEKKADAGLKCCGEHCSDMVNCFSVLAASFPPSLAIAHPASLAPPVHRTVGFDVPDPDSRLRPPTTFLG